MSKLFSKRFRRRMSVIKPGNFKPGYNVDDIVVPSEVVLDTSDVLPSTWSGPVADSDKPEESSTAVNLSAPLEDEVDVVQPTKRRRTKKSETVDDSRPEGVELPLPGLQTDSE